VTRKQLSEAEKAQTPLQEELTDCAPTVTALEALARTIELCHKLNPRDATAALRDYFQWKLAGMSDDALRETRARIAELEGKLTGSS
jgi:hypothetical protein